jgi:Uma2 family endonuclease
MAEYARQGLTEYVLVNKETGQTTAYRIDMTPAEKSEIQHDANLLRKHGKSLNPK